MFVCVVILLRVCVCSSPRACLCVFVLLLPGYTSCYNRVVFGSANLCTVLAAMPLCNCVGGPDPRRPVCECSLPQHVQEWRDYQRQLREQFRDWLAVVNARPPDRDPHCSCECINGIGCNCPRTPLAKRRRLCDDPRSCFDKRCL